MDKKIALISVSDKFGLGEFAKGLEAIGFEIVSTGGTAKAIEKEGIKVTQVEDLTGFPEMLDGRVKTLHPKIHAGILADRSKKKHMSTIKKHGIREIELVVVNFYPFRETISKKNVSLEDAIENIDIGGPTLIRAAAKNNDTVAVVTSSDQYGDVLAELNEKGVISPETRKRLAAKAFELTAAYDATISNFLHDRFLSGEKFPQSLSLSFEKSQSLRYGENWHQEACFYKDAVSTSCGIGAAEQLHGKEISFNNINDANAAIELVKEFEEPAVVIIKHANPCGTAVNAVLSVAFKNALACDSTSAFGSVIALNQECDVATAEQITSFFNEIVIAPSFEKKALAVLKKKKNLRILLLPCLGKKKTEPGLEVKAVEGGILVQTKDSLLLNDGELKVVSKRKPSEKEMNDLLFGWKIAKHTKSNAIVLVKDLASVGVGAGQMSRIDATEIAVKKSNGKHKGAVLASDAFFPFRDNVDLAAKSGITAIIAPGGSVKDEEVIKAADEHGIAMVFTEIRHFKH